MLPIFQLSLVTNELDDLCPVGHSPLEYSFQFALKSTTTLTSKFALKLPWNCPPLFPWHRSETEPSEQMQRLLFSLILSKWQWKSYDTARHDQSINQLINQPKFPIGQSIPDDRFDFPATLINDAPIWISARFLSPLLSISIFICSTPLPDWVEESCNYNIWLFIARHLTLLNTNWRGSNFYQLALQVTLFSLVYHLVQKIFFFYWPVTTRNMSSNSYHQCNYALSYKTGFFLLDID